MERGAEQLLAPEHRRLDEGTALGREDRVALLHLHPAEEGGGVHQRVQRTPAERETEGPPDHQAIGPATTGNPASRHAWSPPARGRMRKTPRRRRRSATRALVASLGHVQ